MWAASRTGSVRPSIECSPLLGPLAFDTVDQVLAGILLPKKITVTDRLFDQDNAKDQLALRTY